jgi:hypothetical protein
MLSCGLVINHPGGGADPGIASLAKPVPTANALIPAYRNACTLNLSGRGIHALKPEASGQAVLAFFLASNSALLDLHCRRRYGDKRGRFALRDIIRVVFFHPIHRIQPSRKMTASRNSQADTAIFSPEGMDRLVRFATLMADSKATVPAHLAGKPADCLAVTMQAAQWGMNPFAVAQKTHVVNGTLGYEAQLVNAVVSSSNLLATRLNYKWDGDWSKVSGKTDKSPSLTVTVWATLKGESEPRTLTISMAQAGVRNSPLWEQDIVIFMPLL